MFSMAAHDLDSIVVESLAGAMVAASGRGRLALVVWSPFLIVFFSYIVAEVLIHKK